MLLERRCPGCGIPAPSICDGCLDAVDRARLRRSVLDETARSLGLDGLHAVGAYGPTLKRLVLHAKNGRRPEVYRVLGPKLASEIRAESAVVTWIPPSRTRRRTRGFDHGRALASEVAAVVGLGHRRLLARVDVERAERRSRQARLAGPRLISGRAGGRRVLLVDDVLTTGGSLAAGAGALRRAGAEHVVAAVLAVVDDTGRASAGASAPASQRASIRSNSPTGPGPFSTVAGTYYVEVSQWKYA